MGLLGQLPYKQGTTNYSGSFIRVCVWWSPGAEQPQGGLLKSARNVGFSDRPQITPRPLLISSCQVLLPSGAAICLLLPAILRWLSYPPFGHGSQKALLRL